MSTISPGDYIPDTRRTTIARPKTCTISQPFKIVE
jgi:hypothetical protein